MNQIMKMLSDEQVSYSILKGKGLCVTLGEHKGYPCTFTCIKEKGKYVCEGTCGKYKSTVPVENPYDVLAQFHRIENRWERAMRGEITAYYLTPGYELNDLIFGALYGVEYYVEGKGLQLEGKEGFYPPEAFRIRDVFHLVVELDEIPKKGNKKKEDELKVSKKRFNLLDALIWISGIIMVLAGLIILRNMISVTNADKEFALVKGLCISNASSDLACSSDIMVLNQINNEQGEQNISFETSSSFQPEYHYEELNAVNSDIFGWLDVPDTKIDYPVMENEDQDYYLRRNVYGKKSSSGCLIKDNTSTDDCIIIHGHNMLSGSMFGGLTKYENVAYFKNHKSINLHVGDEDRNYEVVACFRSQYYSDGGQGMFKYYECANLGDESTFNYFKENVDSILGYDTGLTYGDHILMLSTCAYHTKNGRFVVLARQV